MSAAGVLPEVERLLAQGRHVLVTGEVEDLRPAGESWLPVADGLARLLATMGFPTVVTYNPADGFVFSDAATRDRFERARRGRDERDDAEAVDAAVAAAQ